MTDVFATPATPRTIDGWTLKVGEGFAGPPFQELAHVDLLIGLRDGPVGRAIQRATAGWGEERNLRVMKEQPWTLLVPTVTIRTAKQSRLFERAAAGVELAIDLSIKDGFLPEAILDDVALIVNAFVHPAASIARRVEFNNYKAARHAIRKALEGRPKVDELIAEKMAARHPFRYAP
jgi:formaldehyde-activating enzyme